VEPNSIREEGEYQIHTTFNVGAIYYLDKALGSLDVSSDDITFAKDTEGAVLIWEREEKPEMPEAMP
jgi:hypothetical protein